MAGGSWLKWCRGQRRGLSAQKGLFPAEVRRGRATGTRGRGGTGGVFWEVFSTCTSLVRVNERVSGRAVVCRIRISKRM